MLITASFKHRWITLDVTAYLIDGLYDMPNIYFEHESREVSGPLYDKVFSDAMEALNQERFNMIDHDYERRDYDLYV